MKLLAGIVGHSPVKEWPSVFVAGINESHNWFADMRWQGVPSLGDVSNCWITSGIFTVIRWLKIRRHFLTMAQRRRTGQRLLAGTRRTPNEKRTVPNFLGNTVL